MALLNTFLVSDWLVFVGGALFFGSLLLVAGLFAVLTPSNDNFQKPAPDGEVLLCKPFVTRASMALFALSLFGGMLSQIGIAFSPMTKGGGPIVFVVVVPPLLAVIVWLVSRAGPDEVRLDLKARTYRRLTGWPLFPTVVSGPLNHILGVYVKRVGATSSSRTHYMVGIYWLGRRGRTYAGRFARKETAEVAADRLQSALGLPRVTALR